jgi:hypothetical protein
MGSLPWNVFKAKLNERFTPHNQISKDGQKLLSLCQFDGPQVMGRYVQTRTSLLSFILLKDMHKKWPSSMQATIL